MAQRHTRDDAREGSAGFTLIEMIAVVMILGLAMAVVFPNLSATRSKRLRDQADQIAGRLEIARLQAITSGIPHRLVLDLENGRMRVDWWVDEATAYAHETDESDLPPEEEVVDLNGPIDMSPPLGEQEDFYPIPGKFGRDAILPDDFFFIGVESATGYHESGEVEVVFGGDGTAEYSEISLSDAWDNIVVLEVQPLIELIRIREVEDG